MTIGRRACRRDRSKQSAAEPAEATGARQSAAGIAVAELAEALKRPRWKDD